MTKDEALSLALEAFNDLAAWNDGEIGGHMDEPYSAEIARKAITAIKEALANEALDKMAENARELGLDYGPEQEPVAWAKFSAKGNIIDLLSEPDDDYTPLYTAPPQRKPLTDEEILSISADCAATHQHTDIHFARAIEAALKAKNT
jgi:hypothetical protein